jgi:pyridoxal phosphate enzyme (YggS family)
VRILPIEVYYNKSYNIVYIIICIYNQQVMSTPTKNLRTIQAKIRAAAKAAGRYPASVILVAVSKGHGAVSVREALNAGQRVFGENRVQEAAAKFTALRAAYPDLKLHLIGPLQSNKVEEAVKLFDVIETIDHPKLAESLARAIQKTGRNLQLFIEINIGSEPQKAGIAPEKLGEFLAFCRDTCGLTITGLMCIPPQADDPQPHFAHLKKLANQFQLPHISMGMSADFETAIRCGATEIRVGSAIFGLRSKPT